METATLNPLKKFKMTDNKEHREGDLTSRIEHQTAEIPSITWLAFAGGSMILSAGLFMAGRKEASQFIANWAPSLLLIGVYNKLVKLEGHDRANKPAETGTRF